MRVFVRMPLRRLAAVLAIALAVGCGTPPDAKPTRPVTVRATPFAQRDIEVGGLRLRYIDVRPEAEPRSTVLLIHGHTSRIEEYDGIVPHLAEYLRVLVVDLPGSGYSDKPEREYSLAFCEDTLTAFLDDLGRAVAEFLLRGDDGA